MSESKFKEGDVVYSLLSGEGQVTEIEHGGDGDSYPVYVEFKNNNTGWYTGDGKSDIDHLVPEIYHTKPQIIIPKRKVKKR